MNIINQNKRYDFNAPILLSLTEATDNGKYYIKTPRHNIYMNHDLSVISEKHALFKSYEEATECFKTYMHRHLQNRNWAINYNDIVKTEADKYVIKVSATSFYLYTDGWVYQPFRNDSYLESIGVTKYFDSYEQAKATLAWYHKRCKESITEEASFQCNNQLATIDFMSGKYTLFISQTDNKDEPTWNLPSNEDNSVGLYITPTGSLEIVKIEHATIFDNDQKALFAKLRYKRLHKE
jgi:hypothetical protein